VYLSTSKASPNDPGVVTIIVIIVVGKADLVLHGGGIIAQETCFESIFAGFPERKLVPGITIHLRDRAQYSGIDHRSLFGLYRRKFSQNSLQLSSAIFAMKLHCSGYLMSIIQFANVAVQLLVLSGKQDLVVFFAQCSYNLKQPNRNAR